jgi:4-amino-4-deoxy-L-arabinose transferase-like glycosyltransferase
MTPTLPPQHLPSLPHNETVAARPATDESGSTEATVAPAVRVALLAMVLGALALRLAALDFQSLWRDEVDAIYFALRPLGETLSMLTAAAQNGPLYFLSLRPWLSVVGSSEYALRLPSALAGVASIPLLWQVGRRLVGGTGPRAGGGAPLIAALFLALNPYALWYGQEGKMYTIVTFLALLATWLFLRGVERGGALPWVAYALVVTLAMYTHLMMVLIIPVHFVWFLIVFPSLRGPLRGRRWGYLGALAALTLPYLPMLVWQWEMLTSGRKLTGFAYTPLGDMVRTLLLNHARGFAPGEPLLILAPIYILGAAGLLIGWMELRPPPEARIPPGAEAIAPLVELRDGQRFALLLAWLLLPVLGIWLMSLRQPIFTDRYIIWMLPAWLLLMALGVEVVRHNFGRAGLPLAGAATAAVCAIWLFFGLQQNSTIIKYDLRSAMQLVAERRALERSASEAGNPETGSPESLLILQIPHMEWAYRYYSSDQGTDPFAGSDERLGRWSGGLWTNGGQPDAEAAAEVDAQMRALTAGVEEIWLLLSEVEMWDNRRLMDAWLAQNTEILEQFMYHGAQVGHLRMRPAAPAP